VLPADLQHLNLSRNPAAADWNSNPTGCIAFENGTVTLSDGIVEFMQDVRVTVD
jgi:hypothetical protein